jgi:hypothetical protein
LKKDDYAVLGGHVDYVRPLVDVLKEKERQRQLVSHAQNPWPLKPHAGSNES